MIKEVKQQHLQSAEDNERIISRMGKLACAYTER